MRMTGLATAGLVGALALVAPRDAHAALHLISITKVFPGAPQAPSAQWIELQMYAAGQTVVGGASVVVYNAANVELGRFTFAGNLPNGANQAKILIATAEAAAALGVTPNLTMTAVVPRAGGKICFEAAGFGAIDCVAWGNHPGSATGGGQANVGPPVAPLVGLPLGVGLVRRLDVAGGATSLEGADDRNNSAADFRLALEPPGNNAGQTGTLPAATCGDGTVTGLEGCDDGGAVGGDGCSGACIDEACGDLVVNDDREACDDGNAVNGDGCDNNCTATACGNGVVTGTEACDDGNPTSGDGCDVNCTATACGNGVRAGAEGCDDGNLTSGDGCDVNCTITACGNGVVTAGEDCEPPGVGACDAACQLLCSVPADCADTDPCTTNERCTPTGCAVDPTPTDDGNPCTMDGCGAAGVFHDALDDGTACALGGPARSLCVAGTCVVARCGDGFVDTAAPGGPEQCDDANSVDGDGCTNACTLPRCGDGVVQSGEACDDANPDDTDACTTACELARCGDGAVQTGETCDDSNTVDGDGCTATCQAERCGDGVVQFGEVCDDGNAIETDACTTLCQAPTCGDGIVSTGEACDDGNRVDDDACDNACARPGAEDDAGGCCAGGGAGGPGTAALGAMVAVLLGRRRRRG